MCRLLNNYQLINPSVNQ